LAGAERGVFVCGLVRLPRRFAFLCTSTVYKAPLSTQGCATGCRKEKTRSANEFWELRLPPSSVEGWSLCISDLTSLSFDVVDHAMEEMFDGS